MSAKDPNYTAKLEKAIADKYGEAAIVNPRSLWSPEDEEKYQLDTAKSPSPQATFVEQEKNGYNFESTKLLIKDTRVCSVCGVYSLKSKDGLYLTKFSMCYMCYLKAEINFRWEGRIK